MWAVASEKKKLDRLKQLEKLIQKMFTSGPNDVKYCLDSFALLSWVLNVGC